jgi:3-oxoacyl-(acyl-carrier-protein) synthase
VVNDPGEIDAIESTLWPGGPDETSGLGASQDLVPVLFSHKAALGHTLGVAGLIAVVLNVESHRRGIVPPNVQTTRPLPTRLILSTQPVRRTITHSIVTAAGFGGAVGVIGLVSDKDDT